METSTSEVFTCHLVGVLVSNSEMKLLMPAPKYSYSAARVKCGISQSEAMRTVLEPTQSWFVINPGYAQLPGIQSVIAECGAAADEAL